MFGNQNNQQQQDDNQIPAESIDAAANASITPVDQPWQHPGAPPATDDTGNNSDSGAMPPAAAMPTPAPPPSITHLGAPSVPAATHATDDPDATDANDLIDIKQQALTQLSPLVGHLEQTPEEKFRTTMMMIQASDDQSLVKSAYEAAQNITDEKARAQALLDIINEINYFTQHHAQA